MRNFLAGTTKGTSKTAKYYHENPEARKKKVKYDMKYHDTEERREIERMERQVTMMVKMWLMYLKQKQYLNLNLQTEQIKQETFLRRNNEDITYPCGLFKRSNVIWMLK